MNRNIEQLFSMQRHQNKIKSTSIITAGLAMNSKINLFKLFYSSCQINIYQTPVCISQTSQRLFEYFQASVFLRRSGEQPYLYGETLRFHGGPTNYCPGLPETARGLPGNCPGTARDCPGTARVRETARGLETARGHRIQYNCPEK